METRARVLRLIRDLTLPLRGRGLRRFGLLARTEDAVFRALGRGAAIARVRGHIMHLHLEDGRLSKRLFMTGTHERGGTAVFEALLRPGMTVIDVGANVGYYTLLAARAVGPGGRVYAFEPDPVSYALLRRNVEANGYKNVVAVQEALGDRCGVDAFCSAPDKGFSHLRGPSGGADLQVRVRTLDVFMGEAGWRADVLKLDVEGGELAVWQGMQEVIRRNPQLQIITEYNPEALRQVGAVPEDYLNQLHQAGFDLYEIPEAGPPPIPILPARFGSMGTGESFANLLCRPRASRGPVHTDRSGNNHASRGATPRAPSRRGGSAGEDGGDGVRTEPGGEHPPWELDRQYFFRHTYDSKLRFCCYWHQIHEVLEQKPQSVLEVGIGNGFVSQYLRRWGIPVVTVDIEKVVAPQVVASVLSLPFKDRSFDVVTAFEVLEHLPYESFRAGLRGLARVSRGPVIVSVPDVGRCYRLLVTIPRLGERRWMVELPILRRREHTFDGHHYWEIGKKGFTLSRICRDIQEQGLEIARTFRVFEWPYNRLFVLRAQEHGGAVPDRPPVPGESLRVATPSA